MDEFLEVFGDLKVATVITVLVAIFFIWKLYKTARKQLIEKYKKEEAKEKQVQEIIDQAANYPKWHQQSLDIQQKFSDAIAAIEASQNNNLELLNHLGRMLAETRPPPAGIGSCGSMTRSCTTKGTPRSTSIKFWMM